MRVWRLGAVLLLAGMAAACGGYNTTAIGVIVTAPGIVIGSTATIITNGTTQFSATVTGVSTTTVFWQVCLPASSPTIQPTDCTAIPNVTSASAKVLTGYGTITQTGLYTAPPTPPAPNKFVIMAISTISPFVNATTPNFNMDFGILSATIDSGVRVQVFPTTATIGAGETFQFNATVSGTTNKGVTWSVNGTAGGNTTDGTITASGEYTAPAAQPATSVTITATSAADPSQSGTAALTVSSAGDATLTNIDPVTAAQGSAQQDVYLTGANFFSNDTVFVVPPGQPPTAAPTTFISTSLLRATIPGNLLAQAGPVQVEVQRQNGSLNTPGPAALTVIATRPSVIASSPDSVSQATGTENVILAGGFFTPAATTVQFNGSAVAGTTVNNSRQMTVALPAGGLGTPGLYPITVQNVGVPAGQPAMAALNLAVTPDPSLIPTAPITSATVGTNPSAVAIDYALDLAVVANTGDNTVTLLNLATSPPSVVNTITVGKGPTGVAVDDMLPDHIALVVNSTDQTVSTIDLTTQAVTSTIPVAIGPAAGSPAGPSPVPFSVGVNPLTHHAVVAYESFNEATVLDISTGAPTIVQQIGGDLTAPLGTGTSPNVAVDERLNWAIITPGGGGAQSTNIVDLGTNASASDGGRLPEVIASLALSSFGAGINQETHQTLLTDQNAGNLTSFSLLDNKVNSITFTNGGIALNQVGFAAAAADPLENIGVAINASSATATIVDLENGIVLQTVSGLGTSPQAVAIDPASNTAVVANQGSNSVSVLSLGTSLNPLQIVEASPAVTFTSGTPLTLTITGSGFSGASQVLLDGAPATVVSVSGNGRRIVASVPASMLGSARHYAVQVQNGPGVVSNVTDLVVVQPIVVGNSPTGVAVDTDRDMGVVTNSGDGTVSLVALATTTPVGISQTPAGAVGTIGAPVPVGTNPLGVTVIPRLGFAVVANNGSNNVSLVDLTQTFVPQTVSICSTGGSCTGPTGVAINQDTGVAAITNTGIQNDAAAPSSVSLATVTPATTSAVPSLATPSTIANVDQGPISVAFDPSPIAANPGLSYLAVGTASQASSVEVIDSTTLSPRRLTGFQNPGGIVFDPVNKVFLVADSLQNSIEILDPNTLIQTPVRVGINPTALDYDFQTSTLVTSNLSSHILSVLDYACPPAASGGAPACLAPQVRAALGLGGSQRFSVAIDPRLNLAVAADQANHRVLLVPLP